MDDGDGGGGCRQIKCGPQTNDSIRALFILKYTMAMCVFYE